MKNPKTEPEVIAEINSLHEKFCKAIRKPVQIAIELGELLAKQKEKCGYGKWLPWLKDNVKLDPRQAQRYIVSYNNWGGKILPPNLTIDDASKVFREGPNATLPSHLPKQDPCQVPKPTASTPRPKSTVPPSYTPPQPKYPVGKLPQVDTFMQSLASHILNLLREKSQLSFKLDELVASKEACIKSPLQLESLTSALTYLSNRALEYAELLTKQNLNNKIRVTQNTKLLKSEVK